MKTRILNEAERLEILDNVEKAVAKHFYDRNLCGIDWPACVKRHRYAVAKAESAEAFERAISELLSELKSSHVGFFHSGLKRATSKMAISATYAAFPVSGVEHWVFQDVHEGGAADLAGLRSGEILLSVDGRSFLPPEHPIFPMGQKVSVRVIAQGDREVERTIDIPAPKRKNRQLPYASPKIVSFRRLDQDLGLIKISMFPGVVGVEVANEISQAVAALKPLKRLIFDLRGNTGGGIGVLRVMSLLTPDRVPVGYTFSRKQAGMALDKRDFPVFDHIPSSKLGLLPLALRFAKPKKPIMITTEGLGAQTFHGNVVLLVNRHTASASEMLVAFSKEHQLAKIVGEATPGRLLSGNKFKVGHDYWLALPVGVYHTANGQTLEGKPIEPDVLISFDPIFAGNGRDSQLDYAIELLSQQVSAA